MEIPVTAPLDASRVVLPAVPSSVRCRKGSKQTLLIVDAEAVQEGMMPDGTLALTIHFDGQGPIVGWSSDTRQGTIPFHTATLQEEIFREGQRYWMKWPEYQKKAASVSRDVSPVSSGSPAPGNASKRTTWWIVGSVGGLFVVVLIILAIIMMKRKRIHQQPIPRYPSAPRSDAYA